MPASLEETQITALPARAYYIADFISEEEEQAILRKVLQPTKLYRITRSLTRRKRLRQHPRRGGDSSRIADFRLGPLIS